MVTIAARYDECLASASTTPFVFGPAESIYKLPADNKLRREVVAFGIDVPITPDRDFPGDLCGNFVG